MARARSVDPRARGRVRPSNASQNGFVRRRHGDPMPATAIVNCRVLTVSGGDGDAQEEALLVRGSEIESVGTEKAVLARVSAEDRVIDLGGAFVCPGFE